MILILNKREVVGYYKSIEHFIAEAGNAPHLSIEGLKYIDGVQDVDISVVNKITQARLQRRASGNKTKYYDPNAEKAKRRNVINNQKLKAEGKLPDYADEKAFYEVPETTAEVKKPVEKAVKKTPKKPVAKKEETVKSE